MPAAYEWPSEAGPAPDVLSIWVYRYEDGTIHGDLGALGASDGGAGDDTAAPTERVAVLTF